MHSASFFLQAGSFEIKELKIKTERLSDNTLGGGGSDIVLVGASVNFESLFDKETIDLSIRIEQGNHRLIN